MNFGIGHNNKNGPLSRSQFVCNINQGVNKEPLLRGQLKTKCQNCLENGAVAPSLLILILYILVPPLINYYEIIHYLIQLICNNHRPRKGFFTWH